MIYNTTTNIYERTPQYICNLNQIEIKNQLEKMPINLIYLGIFILILYTIYFFWNYKGSNIYIKELLGIIPKITYILTIFLVGLLSFEIFILTDETIKTIDTLGYIILLPIIMYIFIKEVYKYHKKNKEKAT